MTGDRREIVLIGCGAIVELGHAPALAALDGRCRVRAVVDPAPDRRDALGDRFEVSAGDRYASVDAVLGVVDPSVLAVVAVPTPVLTATVAAVAAAGLPVLAEKPLAGTAAEVREVAGDRLGVVHNYLYRGDVRQALRSVASGAVGTPRYLRLERPDAGHFPGRGADPDWRRGQAAGCLLDNAYHWIYVAEALAASPVAEVCAQLAAPPDTCGPEDLAVLTLRHRNAALTSVQAAWCTPEAAPVLEVHGTAGSLRLVDGGCRLAAAGTEPPPAPEPVDRESSYLAMYRDVFDALDAGRPFAAGAADCARVLTVLDAAYRSATEARTVPVPTEVAAPAGGRAGRPAW